MPKRDKDACNILVVNAIKQVVPGFRHTCDVSSKSVPILGSRVDEYCTVKNGRRTRTTLIPDQLYPICYRMRTKVIDPHSKRIAPNKKSLLKPQNTVQALYTHRTNTVQALYNHHTVRCCFGLK